MCCTTPTHLSSGMSAMAGGRAFPIQCGCGCLGDDQTAAALDRYREHLKAELKHVETRIAQLDQKDP